MEAAGLKKVEYDPMARLYLAEKTEPGIPLGRLVSELCGARTAKRPLAQRSSTPGLAAVPSRPVRHARNKEAVPQGRVRDT